MFFFLEKKNKNFLADLKLKQIECVVESSSRFLFLTLFYVKYDIMIDKNLISKTNEVDEDVLQRYERERVQVNKLGFLLKIQWDVRVCMSGMSTSHKSILDVDFLCF